MDRTRYEQQGETLIEWAAPALLAAATGWAAATIVQSAWIGMIALALILPAGVLIVKRVGGKADRALDLPEFSPEPIEPAADNELLLDDPLASVAPDSRVASLFGTGADTPGAMVTRIADYLGDRAPSQRPTLDDSEGQGADDAAAALHSALANIRASLR